MSNGWKFVLNQTSVEALLSARAADRHRLIQFFRHLTNTPSPEGDFSATDDVGRPVKLKCVGKFLVTYWADHSVREMRVINVERI